MCSTDICTTVHKISYIGLKTPFLKIWLNNPMQKPAGSALLDAPQDVICTPRCQATLLAHTEPAADQHPQVPCCRAALQPSSSSLYLCLALLHPRCGIQHFNLLNFTPLIIAQCSNLPIPLCKTSCPSRESTAPPSLVSSSSLLMVYSNPASRLPINTSNRTGPRTEPRGTPPDWSPAGYSLVHYNPAFQGWKKFFIQRTMNSLILQLDNLSRRWGTVSKAWLKSRKTTFSAFPSSSRWATQSQQDIKLVKQDFPFMNPCWLRLTIALFFICLSIECCLIFFTIFPGHSHWKVIMPSHPHNLCYI